MAQTFDVFPPINDTPGEVAARRVNPGDVLGPLIPF